ncbi:MAG TPA: hypothetical protein VHY20_06085 [Pirellulales bacterium]|jgi:hypothetical protein|nr:hypothetical protein [Pirellulales bacterium]
MVIAAGDDKLWDRLAPMVRLELMLALLCLVLLAFAIFVMIRIGASYARRRVHGKHAPSRLGPHNWAARRFLKRRPPLEPRGDQPRTD